MTTTQTIKAQRFDSNRQLLFDSVAAVVLWADRGLRNWMQPGDFIQHTGIPGKCGQLTVITSEGVETDAHIRWWRED